MNIEDTLKRELIDHGLWEKEADAILEEAKADPANELMKDRWTDDAEGYPRPLLGILWIGIKSKAVDWLKANKPDHWALSMLGG